MGCGVPEMLYVPTSGDGIETGFKKTVPVAGGDDTVGAAVNGVSISGLWIIGDWVTVGVKVCFSGLPSGVGPIGVSVGLLVILGVGLLGCAVVFSALGLLVGARVKFLLGNIVTGDAGAGVL